MIIFHSSTTQFRHFYESKAFATRSYLLIRWRGWYQFYLKYGSRFTISKCIDYNSVQVARETKSENEPEKKRTWRANANYSFISICLFYFPLFIHFVWLVVERKLWKCGSLIRACIRKCWKVASQEISKWTFHAHYYSHLNGNWSASLCMNEIDESKTTKSNPFRYGSRCTRLNVFICHILCPLPRNQSQKRENVKCLFVRELEIFCLLFIHAKVYFSIGTIGRRQNNPDTTVNYV